jgi:tetrahydromethanopterin S-methyltransferase subunit B
LSSFRVQPRSREQKVTCQSSMNPKRRHLQRLPRTQESGLVARFIYALIGFVLGSSFSALLWIFLAVGDSPHHVGNVMIPFSFQVWSLGVGVLFAAIGYIFKDHVGTAIGATINGLFAIAMPTDRDEYHLPRWLVLVLGAVAAYGIYRFLSQTSQ